MAKEMNSKDEKMMIEVFSKLFTAAHGNSLISNNIDSIILNTSRGEYGDPMYSFTFSYFIPAFGRREVVIDCGIHRVLTCIDSIVLGKDGMFMVRFRHSYRKYSVESYFEAFDFFLSKAIAKVKDEQNLLLENLKRENHIENSWKELLATQKAS